jgi:2-amino-4-hydroxy-6-hydroxymethyldihydropteridine diphosphokinase
MSERHRACISLGANIGERERTLGLALSMIGRTPGIALLRISSLYATDPVGYLDQPEFLNCAAIVETSLDPEALLDVTRAIERELGRKARERWREREIDIDIILFDDEVIATDRLIIPHPEMEHRAFVLLPLAEIAPGAVHPVLHRTVRELLEQCADDGGIRRAEIDEWPQPILP